MAKLDCNKSFLFCRGKASERGGREFYSTIFVYDQEESYHIYFQQDGKDVCINKDS